MRIQTVPTVEQAAEAVVLDFEGFEDQPPALMGILVGSEMEQVVLDQRLSSAAIAKGLRVSRLEDELRSLVERCRAENRIVVGFSLHEVQVAERFGGIDIAPYL